MALTRWSVVAVLALLGRDAAAETVVIEAYVGSRPSTVDATVAPLRAALAARELVADPATVGARLEAALSSPGVSDAGLPPDFLDQAELGHRTWIRGDFDAAIATLTPLVAAAQRNPAAIAGAPAARRALHRAYAALALAHQRLGDEPAAISVLEQLVRGFPDEPLTRGAHGPEAHALYTRVADAMAARPAARLTVTVPPGARVWLDERPLTGTASVVPGTYRLLVEHDGRARVRSIDLPDGAASTIEPDLALDRALWTGPTWTGLELTDASELVAQASRLGRALGVARVVVIGLDEREATPLLTGTVVDVARAQPVRVAGVPLRPAPTPDAITDLAGYLAGDEPGPGISVLSLDPRAEAPRGARAGSPWRWITAGLAVATVGAGVTLLVLDDSCIDDGCATLRETATAGWITVGAGAALAGLSTYLFLTRGPRISVSPQAGGAVALVHGRF